MPFADKASNTWKHEIKERRASNDPANTADYEQGFPAITMTEVLAGGIPPDGQDFNGILNHITTAIRYMQAGNLAEYNEEFATKIGGYSNLAIVSSNGVLYRSKSDNNTAKLNDTSKWELLLNNATDSDSTTTAATANAVKVVNDKVESTSKKLDNKLDATNGTAKSLICSLGGEGGSNLRFYNGGSDRAVFFRFDGDGFYLLRTKAGDPKGEWDDARPFMYDVYGNTLRFNIDVYKNGASIPNVNEVNNLINNKAIGENQSIQVLTNNRTLGATYYNNTGRTIQLSVTLQGQDAWVQVFLNGSLACESNNINGQPYTMAGITTIVPPNYSYRVESNSNTSKNIRLWTEIR